MTSEYVTVSTTTDDRAVAERIARGAIEARAGACARITTAESVYRWEGEVTTASEFVVDIKTTAQARPRLEALIRDLHAYDLPEIVAHAIVGGSQDYLAWLSSEVAGPTG